MSVLVENFLFSENISTKKQMINLTQLSQILTLVNISFLDYII